MSKPSSKRITLALVLSLAVHGLVVALWTDEPRVLQAGGQAMTVTLVVHANKAVQSPASDFTPTKKPEPPPKQIQQASKFLEKAPPITTEKAESTIEPDRVAVNPPREAIPVQDVVTQQASDAGKEFKQNDAATTETTNIRLKSVLRKAFNAHFYYPRLAIRRNWQGEVRLKLRINANGHLSHIKVLQASGYELLDKAAMKSLDKVQILPEAIALLNGQSLDLILPVRYQLL